MSDEGREEALVIEGDGKPVDEFNEQGLRLGDLATADGWGRLAAAMVSWDGTEIEFEINRTNPDPEKTFSADAMEHLMQEFGVWVMTRIQRHWHTLHDAPHHLKVRVKVNVVELR